jgi:hypothetical protein
MLRNQTVRAKVALLHYEAEIRQRVESDLIGAANFAMSASRNAVIYNGNILAVVEGTHNDVQIARVLAANVILDCRQSYLVRYGHDELSLLLGVTVQAAGLAFSSVFVSRSHLIVASSSSMIVLSISLLCWSSSIRSMTSVNDLTSSAGSLIQPTAFWSFSRSLFSGEVQRLSYLSRRAAGAALCQAALAGRNR